LPVYSPDGLQLSGSSALEYNSSKIIDYCEAEDLFLLAEIVNFRFQGGEKSII